MSGKQDKSSHLPRQADTPKRAKLQIIHRNRMLRECLIAVLSNDSQYVVTEVDHRATEGLFIDGDLPADVVLIDAGLPDGLAIELIQRVRQHCASTKVLAVVSAAGKEMVIDCIVAGAHGCILEESSLEDLRDGIEAVLTGDVFCSQDMIQVLFSEFAEIARDSHIRKLVQSADLSARELEILELISGHLGNKQIAKRLSVSIYTVKNHVHNILKKLALTSRFEAVDYARQRRWIAKRDEDSRSSVDKIH